MPSSKRGTNSERLFSKHIYGQLPTTKVRWLNYTPYISFKYLLGTKIFSFRYRASSQERRLASEDSKFPQQREHANGKDVPKNHSLVFEMSERSAFYG